MNEALLTREPAVARPSPAPQPAAVPPAMAAPAVRRRTPRDPRLDFFRGLAMLIILIAHIPWNFWANWIPARFGPSDAAEMFVFSSGYAAAIAFGGTFLRHGWWMGTRRILLRFWQIYWAHIGLFVAIATVSVIATRIDIADGKNYVNALNLQHFFNDPQSQLTGLLTLTYVPNYFDILPMYMVILLLVPVIVLLQRIHLGLAVAFSLGLYAAAWAGLELPAEPWSDRPWFFNPFAWQLLFFTAFAFSRGWIPVPPFRPWLLWAAAAFVLVMIPISHFGLYPLTPVTRFIHESLWGGAFTPAFKTNIHPIRILHFLALAYLAVWFVSRKPGLLESRLARPVIRVGQQALATFMSSMAVAWIMGMFLDVVGRDGLTVSAANVIGLASVFAVAYLVGWYKREPWRRPAPATG